MQGTWVWYLGWEDPLEEEMENLPVKKVLNLGKSAPPPNIPPENSLLYSEKYQAWSLGRRFDFKSDHKAISESKNQLTHV